MNMRFIIGFVALAFSIILISRSRRALVPDVIDHEFGVAFDLTFPYGTAAISYPNGTVVNVAKIDALPSYREMFSRLSLHSSEHLHPPYVSVADALRDYSRQMARTSRKAAGLPASTDVGELAKLIISLRLAVEAHLDGRIISGAAVTIPHLAAIYSEDLEDAFEYVGLIYLPQYPYWYGGIFPESGAVYTGNGFGLCSNYTDRALCDEEKRSPPHQPSHENILSIAYTTGILTSTWSIESMGFSYPGSDMFKLVDLNLGWDERHENPNDDYYWETVRDAIVKPALEAIMYHHSNTSKILLHGDRSTNQRFQEVLKEVVHSILGNEIEIFELDPVFAAVRGAAEMAKIVYWDYNQTRSGADAGSDL
ncbi:hypothetical protein VTL71DRAFT_9975 [Oculimacula yallundae]|uniref:Uncharacterized protein n=1 Tax=Oculimacula yallundae TaxID=86028 RepID=A0ABR4BR83_9HELO